MYVYIVNVSQRDACLLTENNGNRTRKCMRVRARVCVCESKERCHLKIKMLYGYEKLQNTHKYNECPWIM